jgi:tetrahydromethanopterin S-methyltransferase subunit C
MPWDEDEMADELMRWYRDTLRKVASKHLEWAVPQIAVISATSGALWGTLEVETLD